MLTLGEIKQIELRDYQLAAIEALREHIRAGRRRIILCAGTGAGKCLGYGTPILMADGTIKQVQDVRVGDRLASPTGKPTTVLSLARGREMMFRVTPTKGDPYTCNASHLLSLRLTGGKRCITLADGTRVRGHDTHVICRADTFFASNKTAKHCLKGWRAPVTYFDGQKTEFPVPPYIFGVWLGDGSKRFDRCAISKPEGAVVNAWKAWAASMGASVRRSDSNGTRCPTWNITTDPGQTNPCLNAIRATGVNLETLEIPRAYKTASIENRAELLAGLLDTDGAVSRGGWDFISKHYELAQGVAFIARSIGLAAYVAECRKGIRATGFSNTYWRVSISGDASLVPCRSKRPRNRTSKKNPLRHGIKIEPIGIGEYYGFEITGDRLFMLGDFTVTHNTVTAAKLLAEAARKGSYSLFIVDRVALVDQTSAVLDSYGIPHGVIQGNHPRWEPREHVQVCSAQTLARRVLPRAPSLIVVDEAHCRMKATIDLMDRHPEAVCIGLTATPFTRGMARDWHGIVNVRSTRLLIEDGHLIEPMIYVAKSPDDAELAVGWDGEFSDESATAAGIKIVGDVVREWERKTREHFGGPVKTIVFSPTVAHGRALCAEFRAAGYNFQQISYLDRNDAERAAKIAEFRRPDSVIVGLVSCGVLTKGFDVPDCLVGISCRPYRKSLSSHMQEIGRVMRPAPGKDKALWLDHSGNIERFAGEMFDVWQNGAGELDAAEKQDSKPRARDKRQREALTCPECSAVMRGPTCLACGYERPARSGIVTVDGTLQAFDTSRYTLTPRDGLHAACLANPRTVWNAALIYTFARARDPNKARRWAYGIWAGIYPGAKLPRGWFEAPVRGAADNDALALVEREVRRFRKQRSAA